jgi:hypothetical protein
VKGFGVCSELVSFGRGLRGAYEEGGQLSEFNWSIGGRCPFLEYKGDILLLFLKEVKGKIEHQSKSPPTI